MIVRYNLFTIIWAAAILLTTLLPSTSLPSGLDIWEILSFDSFAHVFLFCVLCFLMIVGLSKQFTFPNLSRHAVRASLLISTLFGILIEVTQHFLIYGRQGDIIDVLANTIGCLLGVVLFKLIYVW